MTRALLAGAGLLCMAVLDAALQHGYGSWTTRNCRRWGRWADRILPDDEREFANFTALGDDIASAIERGQIGGVHGLVRMASGLAGACWVRSRSVSRRAGRTGVRDIRAVLAPPVRALLLRVEHLERLARADRNRRLHELHPDWQRRR